MNNRMSKSARYAEAFFGGIAKGTLVVVGIAALVLGVLGRTADHTKRMGLFSAHHSYRPRRLHPVHRVEAFFDITQWCLRPRPER